MTPITFYSYRDHRGDLIVYKFDPDVARMPNINFPNDSAVSVLSYHESPKFYHSRLVPLEEAMQRWRNDNQTLQPPLGMVIYTEYTYAEDGSVAQKAQYIWKGWSHGEGYRRGWAKLNGGGDGTLSMPLKPKF
ncbi:hypothetical protein B5807_03107 [Epicoccum nigrum]|jgi:hypothetical protein|uniref:Uncharacterized protein n=1 Tax=Epicoccum nigrum TaxID=105696 RepID=A0A1Y2M889_EPING|nr:hypothetical protein B5807_03107 [Epicoccum nigrum]